MQQVVQQRMGHGVRPGGQEQRGALDPVWRLRADAVDEQWQRQRGFVQALHHYLLAALPGRHQGEQQGPGNHRESAALEDLRHVGGEEQAVDEEEAQQHRNGQPARRLP
ncbi:hypothetical protein D3C78_375700 [compost metagenome]